MTEVQILTIAGIVLWVVGLGAGVLLAVLLRSVGRPAPHPAGEEQPEPPLPNGDTLRLVRTPAGARWDVVLGGARISDASLLTAEQRRLVERAAEDLQRFLLAAAPPEPTSVTPVAPVVPLAPRPAAREERPSKPILRMVDQINAILLQRLPGSPYAGQTIHLVETATGTISFVVDSTPYPDLDSIPDPGIRDLIRSAVAHWEKSI